MKRLNLVGQTFGDLKVIKNYYGSDWVCVCSCGKGVVVNSRELRSGLTHSCGNDNPKVFKDIKGQVFGEWEVLEWAGSGYWVCRCSCGTIKKVAGWNLRSGRSTSCGHDRREDWFIQDLKKLKR